MVDTPELQPAGHLWPLVDEPVVNRHCETRDELDAALSERCRTLAQDRSLHRSKHNQPLVANTRCTETITRIRYHFPF